MMTDINSMFDLLDATFAKGLRTSELSLSQVLQLLRKVEELLTSSKFEIQLGCGVEVLS